MILSFINIGKVPREMLKTLGFALGLQHLPRDLANVNEWKIMFDPYRKVQTYMHCYSKADFFKEMASRDADLIWRSNLFKSVSNWAFVMRNFFYEIYLREADRKSVIFFFFKFFFSTCHLISFWEKCITLLKVLSLYYNQTLGKFILIGLSQSKIPAWV